MATIDKHTLQNPLLISKFLKKYPFVDSSMIDQTHGFEEAEEELKDRYPHLMIQDLCSQKDAFLSVNSYYYGPYSDDSSGCRCKECSYCGQPFTYKRSTAEYCSPSHRVLMYRKRQKIRRSEEAKQQRQESRAEIRAAKEPEETVKEEGKELIQSVLVFVVQKPENPGTQNPSQEDKERNQRQEKRAAYDTSTAHD